MATIKFKNGDGYLKKISRIESSLKTKICGSAIYVAADIVADEVRKQLQSIPTDESYGTDENMSRGPKKVQKKGLYDSLGISPMSEDEKGNINVKIGFDGYNGVKTKRWPNGQPNQMVARSVERGTSFMKKNAFIKKAVSSSKAVALKKMKETVDEQIEKAMKG